MKGNISENIKKKCPINLFDIRGLSLNTSVACCREYTYPAPGYHSQAALLTFSHHIPFGHRIGAE